MVQFETAPAKNSLRPGHPVAWLRHAKAFKQSQKLDLNQLAVSIILKSTQERQKNPAAVALGRLEGLKGEVARAAFLSSKQRKEIAKAAARVR